MKIVVEDTMPDGMKITLTEEFTIDTYEDLQKFFTNFAKTFPNLVDWKGKTR